MTPPARKYYVLGIDSGGTKTAAAVADKQVVLGQGESGPGSIATTPIPDLVKHLQSAVRRAMRQAKLPNHIKFNYIVVGMAGIDDDSGRKKAERVVRQALQKWKISNATISVLNDIHVVRRSGTDYPYGIALISGTGSHAMGINPQGDIARVSGVEYLLGDEGSGYDIGLKALRSAVRSADGRMRKTALVEAVMKHFGIKQMRDLVPIIYKNPGTNKAIIAELAPVVEDLAWQHDWRAKEIMDETINELILDVATLVQRLKLKPLPFDIVIAGGIFKMKKVAILKKFKQGVKRIAPKATVVLPKRSPVWGAVRLAQDQLRQDIS